MGGFEWAIFGFYGLTTTVTAVIVVYLIVKRIKSKKEEHFERDN